MRVSNAKRAATRNINHHKSHHLSLRSRPGLCEDDGWSRRRSVALEGTRVVWNVPDTDFGESRA